MTYLASLLVLGSAELSVRVDGDGYLRFLRDGRAVFARTATLVVEGGELREKSGPGFLPPIRISAPGAVEIAEDGTVTAGGAKAGRLVLAKFAPGSLFELSGNFVLARDRADLGFPKAEGYGKIVFAGEGGQRPNALAPNAASKNTSTPQHLTPRVSPLNAGSVQILIADKAEVDGPRFTLGEIAEVKSGNDAAIKAIDLGNAPVHGIPLSLTRDRILAKVALLGFDRKAIELEMPAITQIHRRGQVVKPEQLVVAACQAVQTRLGLSGEFTSSDKMADIHVPLGKLEIVDEGASLSNGIATVNLALKVDGKRFLGRTLRLTGAGLDLVVKAGASVTVRFVSNGLMVELPGKARTAGAVGQTIDVMITAPDSRESTLHPAVVKSAGVVEVKL